MSISTEGSVTVYLKWVQDIGDDTPVPAPKTVLLHIWGDACADSVAPPGQTTVESKFGEIPGIKTSEIYPDDGVVLKYSNAVIYGSNPLKIPLTVAEGESEVEYTFSLHAKATNEEIDKSPDDYGWSFLGGSVTFHATQADIGVGISSDIETSWKKWTGAASGLADAYKKRDASHKLIDEPNDKAVLVFAHPTDASKNIWKLACLRAADGTMTVESAASWRSDPAHDPSHDGSFRYSWYGRGSYSANVAGLSTPSYAWSQSGGTYNYEHPLGSSPLGQDTPTIDLNFSVGDMGVPGWKGLDLGGEANGSGMTKSSTIDVTVTDPSLPNLSLTDSYKVNWHSPYENVVERPSTQTGVDPAGNPTGHFTYTMTPGMATGTIGYTPNTNEENGYIEVWINPSPVNFVTGLNGNDWRVVGVVATVGTGAAVPAAAALAKGWFAMAACLTASGTGYYYTSGPPAADKQPCVNNAASWQRAVSETQQAISNQCCGFRV